MSTVTRTAETILAAVCIRPDDVRIVEDYYQDCEAICGVTFANLQAMAKLWLLLPEISQYVNNARCSWGHDVLDIDTLADKLAELDGEQK